MLGKLQAKLAGLGAILLAIVAEVARMQFLKQARDRQRERADVADARVRQEEKRRKIIKEEGIKRLSSREELIKEIEKRKRIKEGSDEKFEGLHNLNEPNDY